jgi:hypothetical protein
MPTDRNVDCALAWFILFAPLQIKELVVSSLILYTHFKPFWIYFT